MERSIEVPGISEEFLARVDQRARQIGVDRNSYLKKVIERAVAPPEFRCHPRRTFETYAQFYRGARHFGGGNSMLL